jgi:tRNA G26 N,N-dimethylase Trm1
VKAAVTYHRQQISRKTMNKTYKISFRTQIKASKSLQKLHDCLKQLNVKHWAYDFQEFLLTLTSELPDFTRIQLALRSAGYVCHFIKLENMDEASGLSLG